MDPWLPSASAPRNLTRVPRADEEGSRTMCEAVSRRDRIQGSQACLSLNSRLESNKEEEEEGEGSPGSIVPCGFLVQGLGVGGLGCAG